MANNRATLREFTESLLAKIDIVDIVSARIALQPKSKKNYFACCPFHTEKTASFSVSEPKQFFHCFGCGAHGNAIDFLMRYEHMEFMETLKTLASIAGMTVPSFSDRPQIENNHENNYELMEKVAQFYYQQLKDSPRAIAYLKQRGISGEIARAFKIGYAQNGWHHLIDHFKNESTNQKQLLEMGLIIKKDQDKTYDRFRDRIMFPIQDHKGRYIAFGGRIIDQGEPKYLNSPETSLFQKGQTCYGLHQVVMQNAHQVPKILVVEGYMDVIALFQHGIHYAVAALGTAVTAHHLKRLMRYTKQLYFCFDGDNAGRLAARRALSTIFPLLTDELQVYFLFLPEKEDPDSMVRKEGKTQFEERLYKSTLLSDFFFQTLSNDIDLTTMEGRAQLTSRALQLIKMLPPILFQDFLLTELSKRVRLDLSQLKARMDGNQAIVFNKPPTKKVSAKTKTKSPLAIALALLVQNPSLSAHLPEMLPDEDDKPWQLLKELKKTLSGQNIMTTGILLERWHDRPDLEDIVKLANFAHVIPDNGIIVEFQGALKQALSLYFKHKINQLIEKGKLSALTQEEKAQLSLWIEQKDYNSIEKS